MSKRGPMAAGMIMLAACTAEAPSNSPRRVEVDQREAPPIIPPPGTGPDARTPLRKPEKAIDPKGPEAARRLVQGFADLLNARKFDVAYEFLRSKVQPPSEFVDAFAQYSGLNVNVGAPTDQQGAAGSIYVKVPLTISGTANGKQIKRHADAVLRRVNDVAGSTEAQRQWHLERIDWAGSLVG